MKRYLIFLGIFSLPVVSPASAEEIGRLAASAYCRDESGHVRNPRVRPAERTEAARVARGMIKTAAPVDGTDCYFYLSEVALGPPKPCSSPSVGGQDKKIAGTLDVQSCADR
jgi:hypothetical protein